VGFHAGFQQMGKTASNGLRVEAFAKIHRLMHPAATISLTVKDIYWFRAGRRRTGIPVLRFSF
jgi:hypothetical protein